MSHTASVEGLVDTYIKIQSKSLQNPKRKIQGAHISPNCIKCKCSASTSVCLYSCNLKKKEKKRKDERKNGRWILDGFCCNLERKKESCDL